MGWALESKRSLKVNRKIYRRYRKKKGCMTGSSYFGIMVRWRSLNIGIVQLYWKILEEITHFYMLLRAPIYCFIETHNTLLTVYVLIIKEEIRRKTSSSIKSSTDDLGKFKRPSFCLQS